MSSQVDVLLTLLRLYKVPDRFKEAVGEQAVAGEEKRTKKREVHGAVIDLTRAVVVVSLSLVSSVEVSYDGYDGESADDHEGA